MYRLLQEAKGKLKGFWNWDEDGAGGEAKGLRGGDNRVPQLARQLAKAFLHGVGGCAVPCCWQCVMHHENR